MADVPHEEDKRLLERLNALKPSTVQLERQRYAIFRHTGIEVRLLMG